MILFGIVGLLILMLVAYRSWYAEVLYIKSYYWPALLVKLCAGIALGLIYQYYYQDGDTWVFFSDGRVLSSWARENAWEYIHFLVSGDSQAAIGESLVLTQHRSLFLTKWVSVVNLITGDNYWMTSLYFSFFSFAGSWFFFRTISKIYFENRVALAVVVLFFPSVVFWGSGIGKESLAMGSLFVLSAQVVRMWVGKRMRIFDWISILISAWLLWRLKYFYAGIFFPVSLSVLLAKKFCRYTAIKSFGGQVIVWVVLLTLFLSLIIQTHINFSMGHVLSVIVKNHDQLVGISSDDNLIHYHALSPTWERILFNSPKALVSGLTRPYFWESGGLLKKIAGIENFVLFLVIITSFFKRRARRESFLLLVTATASYILILCVLVSLSTPNVGTLNRYRVGFMPFWALLFVINHPLTRTLQTFLNRIFFRLGR